MARRFEWAVALCATVVAGFVGATCSATGSPNGFDSGGAGAGVSTSASGSAGGLFTGSGGAGGGLFDASAPDGSKPGECDASCKLAGGTCVSGVCTLNENPGNVDPGTQSTLEGGGNGDATFKWLYPYDKTVFPRGLLPPTMQLAGAAASAVYVHVTSPGMSYKGFFGASSPIRVTLPEVTWKALTLAAKADEWVKVEITKISGGQVAGPVSEQWRIAQGSLRGTIYYETYDSQLAGGLGSVGIMKIAPGAQQPTVVKSGCGNVCHTASADGSTLVASTAFPFGSASYDLKNNAVVIKAQPDNSFTYGGIYPDGSILVSATNYRTWLGNPSLVYDTKTGAQIPTPSWESAVKSAAMPAFAPDGKWIVFNREDTGGGHSLATMGYDPANKSFSGLADLTSDPSRFLGWPAFTPDSKWVVYHAGSNQVFETDSDATGDLFIVDVATHVAARLDALDGYANAQVYLPANDPNLSFAPTVLPEAVGGYFWTVFTSHRSYGNTLPSKDNNDQNGKLWVAAIDLQPTAGQDPSHPAFYLDGQESGADNLRGFWVLPPCKQDSNDCQSGDECCGGFCHEVDGGTGQCASTQMGCSKEFEKCTTDADCCDPADTCINGHCAGPPPPK